MRTCLGIMASCIAFLSFGFVSEAQGGISKSAEEELLNPKPIDQTVLEFDEKDVVLPALSEDDEPYRVDFSFRNITSKAITITKVITSCGCVSADLDSTLKVGASQKGSISVAFNPDGYSGKVYKKIYVYTDASASHPTAILSLSGTVSPSSDPWKHFPHRIGSLRTKQEKVVFKVGKSTSKLAEAIAGVNAGQETCSPKAVGLPEYLSFKSIPESVKPAEEMDLVFILDARKIPADHPSKIETDAVLKGIGEGSNNRITIMIEFENNK